MPNFIFPILILIYVFINIKYSKYQVLNLSNFICLIPVIFISIFLERYQFIVNLFILINIFTLLFIPFLHLINRKNTILKQFRPRYFYIFTLIIYLYIFLLLMGKNQPTIYKNQIMFPSIIIIFFALGTYFLIKSIPINKNNISLKPSILLSSINIFLLFVISTISLIYYPIPIMRNAFIIAILFLIPIILKCCQEIKLNNFNYVIRYITTSITTTFIIIGIIDLLIPISIYLFIETNSIKFLEIGLYTSCILIFPMIKKLKYPFLYDLIMFIIILIIIYYLY